MVCSRKGTATFSANVSELNNAALLKHDPEPPMDRLPMSLQLPAVDAEETNRSGCGCEQPHDFTQQRRFSAPVAAGDGKDLSSPTERLTSACTTAWPNRVDTWLTSMIGVSVQPASCLVLDACRQFPLQIPPVQQNTAYRVEHNHQKDPLHHTDRRMTPDIVHAAANLKPLVQPTSAMSMAKTGALAIPIRKCRTATDSSKRETNSVKLTFNWLEAMSIPPNTPSTSA